MDTLVSPRAADEGRLFGVVGIRFRDRASRNEGLKQIAFDCFLVVRPAALSVLSPASLAQAIRTIASPYTLFQSIRSKPPPFSWAFSLPPLSHPRRIS